VIATSKAHLPTLKEQATNATSAFTNEQEQLFQAASPLAKKPVTKSIALELEGNMQKYIWKINNQIWPYITPPQVASGDRVELVFINQTSMSHPMHLHGHTFQVTNVNGKDIHGANRDTILVLPHSTMKVQFDANNPGVWLLHCHNLYHAASGMITKLLYNKYKAPAFSFLQQGSMSGAFLYTNPQECAAQ
jgi:FtsP/CotA-like multicopper oxidase with cupredoxin domain